MEYRVLFLHHSSVDIDKTLKFINQSDFLVQCHEIADSHQPDYMEIHAAVVIIQTTAGTLSPSLYTGLRANLPDAPFILILDSYQADIVKQFIDITTGYHLLENQLDLLPTILAKQLEKQLSSLNRELLIQVQHQTILTLATRPSVVRGEWDSAVREITRITSKSVSISRVSIWLFNEEQDSMICQMLYNLDTGQYEQGEVLRQSDYLDYFKALQLNRVIVASKASEHPATRDFGKSYFPSHNIKSLLDAPIRLRGEMIGVLCCEQTGEIREWSLDDQQFAAAVADLASHTIENQEHRFMQDALQQSHGETRDFIKKLTILHEISLELAASEDFDDLCRKAILLGRDRLGFARVGIWFVDEQSPDMIVGSFGTDEDGNLRDERHMRLALDTNSVYQSMRDQKISLQTKINSPLYNHTGELIGHGWLGVVSLWDGQDIIGWMSVDYLNQDFRAAKYHGELLRLYGLTVSHLCKHKQIQFVLQQSESYLKQAESIAHLGNFSFNIQTQEILWSDEVYRIFGQQIGTEITLEHYQNLLPPEAYERVMNEINNTLIHKQGYEIEHDIILEDGIRKHLFARGRPILDANGDVAHIFGIVQDITERYRAAQQRIELKINKEKLDFLRDFVEHMTHDLKTPLAGLKATSYVLQKTEDPLKKEEQIVKLDLQVNYLEQMIDDILTVARLDHMPEVTFVDIQLNHLITETSQQLQAKAQQKEIQFQLDLDQNLPKVTAAPNELRRALLNLIENALNYTPKRGTITIRTYMKQSRIVCEVEDTGIGIDTADLPRIFDQFYRADNARSFERGTGLGLVIVNKIVQLHDGEIQVNSVLGKGTRFIVNFQAK